MKNSSLWVFSDESGDLAQRDSGFVIFGVVTTPQIKILRDAVKNTRRRYPKYTKRKPYLHAADDPPEVTRYLLGILSKQENISIGVTIFSRKIWFNQNQDREDLYQKLMAHAIRLSLSNTLREIPSLTDIQVIVENRYKNNQRNSLITTISSQIDVTSENIHSERKTHSEWGPALQVADAIAWSWYQKFEKKDDTFSSILANGMPIIEVILGVDGNGEIRPVKDIIGE